MVGPTNVVGHLDQRIKHAFRPLDSQTEDFCERCGGRNLPRWHAPSPLWNAVMRDADGAERWGIVCPQCFAELAEAKGVTKGSIWCLRLDVGLVSELPTHSLDGRTWNPATCLWETPITNGFEIEELCDASD